MSTSIEVKSGCCGRQQIARLPRTVASCGFPWLVLLLIVLCGCATRNLVCSDGCKVKEDRSDSQFSPYFGDRVVEHPSNRDIMIHEATGAWELRLDCGAPGTAKKLFKALAPLLVMELVKVDVGEPLASVAGGLTLKATQAQNLTRRCKRVLEEINLHNNEPRVADRVARWPLFPVPLSEIAISEME